MENRPNHAVLDQAAAISTKAGQPEAMGQVNALLEDTITRMAIADMQAPNIDDFRERIAEVKTRQTSELAKILPGHPSNPDQPQ